MNRIMKLNEWSLLYYFILLYNADGEFDLNNDKFMDRVYVYFDTDYDTLLVHLHYLLKLKYLEQIYDGDKIILQLGVEVLADINNVKRKFVLADFNMAIDDLF